MIILVDVGNSKIKSALYIPEEAEVLAKRARGRAVQGTGTDNGMMDKSAEQSQNVKGELIEHEPYLYNDINYKEVITRLVVFLHDLYQTKISRVLISNVAGENIATVVNTAIWQYFKVKPEYLVPGKNQNGLTNGYVVTTALGADRWLNLISAYNIVKTNTPKHGFCVISFGTAITVDAVDSNFKHLGGFIIPGLLLMENSLIEQTKDIKNKILLQKNNKKLAAAKKSSYFLANNTKHAITGGIHYAVIAFIERILEDLDSIIDNDYKVFITGGDGEKIATMLSVNKNLIIANDLLWQGMISLL